MAYRDRTYGRSAVLQATRIADMPPVCSDPAHPLCVGRLTGESREAFIARLADLYEHGALAAPCTTFPPLTERATAASISAPTLPAVVVAPLIPTRIPLPTNTPCPCGQPRTFGIWCDDCRLIDRQRVAAMGGR